MAHTGNRPPATCCCSSVANKANSNRHKESPSASKDHSHSTAASDPKVGIAAWHAHLWRAMHSPPPPWTVVEELMLAAGGAAATTGVAAAGGPAGDVGQAPPVGGIAAQQGGGAGVAPPTTRAMYAERQAVSEEGWDGEDGEEEEVWVGSFCSPGLGPSHTMSDKDVAKQWASLHKQEAPVDSLIAGCPNSFQGLITALAK
ncbi:hypothetical protein V8C86DRAFT_2446987, partial [Haematococcus lacustris]